uniref:Uncharacterized protein n=1 Tax=Oryza nivara TaxID=4536 RepID=A0A0E0ICU6_ORYNI
MGRPDPSSVTAGRPDPSPATAGRPDPSPATAGRPDPSPATAGRPDSSPVTAGRPDSSLATAGMTAASLGQGSDDDGGDSGGGRWIKPTLLIKTHMGVALCGLHTAGDICMRKKKGRWKESGLCPTLSSGIFGSFKFRERNSVAKNPDKLATKTTYVYVIICFMK